MTVGQLRDMLADYDPSTDVIMSQDAEGNSFSPLATISLGHFERRKESWWRGTFSEPDDLDLASPLERNAICLWPAN